MHKFQLLFCLLISFNIGFSQPIAFDPPTPFVEHPIGIATFNYPYLPFDHNNDGNMDLIEESYFGQIVYTGNVNGSFDELKGWSQNEHSKKIEAPSEVIGRYERNDATPSIDIAKRMAMAFELSLDYLVGNAEEKVDKATLHRVLEINKLPGEDKKVVFSLLDAFITNRKLKSVIQ